MKKYIVLFLFLLSPLNVFSSEPPIYKEDMINAAKEHKLEAWKALDCADNI